MNEELVLVLSHKQAAALCIAATTSMLSGMLPLDIYPDMAEAIITINEAVGNPSPAGFAEVLDKLRKQIET